MKKNGEAFRNRYRESTKSSQMAEGGRKGEIRYLGEIDATPDAVAKLVRKLAGRYETLRLLFIKPGRRDMDYIVKYCRWGTVRRGGTLVNSTPAGRWIKPIDGMRNRWLACSVLVS